MVAADPETAGNNRLCSAFLNRGHVGLTPVSNPKSFLQQFQPFQSTPLPPSSRTHPHTPESNLIDGYKRVLSELYSL